MKLEDEYALSYYERVGAIGAQRSSCLVRHVETGEFFVRKQFASCDCDINVYKALQHSSLPGIPHIYELVEDGGDLILIEEFFQGQTLQEFLNEHGSLSEEQVIDLVRQLTCIVQGLHRLSPPIVHGSLSPSSVVISPGGKMRLYDFRAARFASQEAAAEADADYADSSSDKSRSSEVNAASLHQDIQAIDEILRILMTQIPYSEKAALKDDEIKDVSSEKFADTSTKNATGKEAASAAIKDAAGSVSSENGSSRTASAGRNPSWRRFLPPGFRSGKPVNMAAAAVVYAFLLLILCLEIRYGADDPLIFGTLMAGFLIIILFSADYVGVQSHLPLTRSSKAAVRVLGIFLYDILIFAAAIIIAAVLDTFVHV